MLTRRSPEELNAAVEAAAFTALARHAGKLADRERLLGGEAIPVALDVQGHVGGHWFEREIAGTLQIGHDQTGASSSGPDLPHLVAALLEQLGPKKRNQTLAAWGEGGLPEVKNETKSAAATLLERLRDKKTVNRKGNVRFEPKA